MNAGIAKLTVGRPEDDAAIVPVVSESSAKFVEGLVMDAKEKGATLCQEYKREVQLGLMPQDSVDGVPEPQMHRPMVTKQPALLKVLWLLCRATSSGRCCWTT